MIEQNLNVSGVYCWRNLINGKVYIGSAVNIKNRNRPKERGNRILRAAIKKYGEENFELVVQEVVLQEEKTLEEFKNQLLEREQHWLDHYKSYEGKFGYNICSQAGSPLGIKLSEILTPEQLKKRWGSNRKNCTLYWENVSEDERKKRADIIAESWSKLSVEGRKQRAEKAANAIIAKSTAEQRSARVKAGINEESRKKRSERRKEYLASLTPEERSKMAKARSDKLSKQERSRLAKERMGSLTAEQKLEMSKKGNAAKKSKLDAMTPEEREARRIRIATAQVATRNKNRLKRKQKLQEELWRD